MTNEVSHPAHYAGDGLECKDAMAAMVAASGQLGGMQFYWWLSAFKYLWRWSCKGGIEDLEKCKQCIDYLISESE